MDKKMQTPNPFTIAKAILPQNWQTESAKQALQEFLDCLNQNWETNCPMAKEFLQLDQITLFDTDNEGYYRFQFSNIPGVDLNEILINTIQDQPDYRELDEELIQELNLLLDNDGASSEPNHWHTAYNISANTLQISILMAWSE